MESEQIFIGIADAHGIESFIPITGITGSTMFVLQMRAMANRQRHALVYTALINNEIGEKIQKMLNNGGFKEALQFLKTKATKIEIDKDFMNSWELIPNDKLDPFF